MADLLRGTFGLNSWRTNQKVRVGSAVAAVLYNTAAATVVERVWPAVLSLRWASVPTADSHVTMGPDLSALRITPVSSTVYSSGLVGSPFCCGVMQQPALQ